MSVFGISSTRRMQGSSKKEPPQPKSVTPVKSKKNISVRDLVSVPLSRILEQYPQLFGETKISAVQKCINCIDPLPRKYLGAEIIYLSNNNLRDISGLEQFKNARTLSLANNCITELQECVRVLKELPYLDVLNLTGNPVCKDGNYKSYIIMSLPYIKNLDGRELSEEEKSECEIRLRKQSNLLDLMLTNYIEIIKLISLNRKLECHIAFMQKNRNFCLNYNKTSVETFKKSFKFMDYLDDRFKDSLRQNLLKDINTLQTQLISGKKDDFEIAYSELIMRQQQKTAEISTKIQKKFEIMSKISEESKAKMKDRHLSDHDLLRQEVIKQDQLIKEQRSLSRDRKKKNLEKSDAKSFRVEFLNSETPKERSGRKVQKFLNQTGRDDMMSEPDLYQRLNMSATSPNNFLDYVSASTTPVKVDKGAITSGLQRNLAQNNFVSGKRINTKEKSPEKDKEVPEPSVLDKDPIKSHHTHHESCCRGANKTSRAVSPSKIISPLSSRRDADQVVEQLKKLLQDKIKENKSMEEVNNTLRERLRDYQHQNHENVRIANAEIGNIHGDLEKKSEMQKLLKSELKQARVQLNDMMLKNVELERVRKEHELLTQRAHQYAVELEHIAKEDALHDMAVQFDIKRRKRAFINWFIYCMQTEKLVRRFREQQIIKCKGNYLPRAFESWKKTTYTNKIITYRKRMNEFQNVKLSLQKWRENAIFNKNYREFSNNSVERKLKIAIIAWKRYLDHKERKTRQAIRSQNFYLNSLQRRVWRNLKEWVQRYRFTSVEEKKLSKISEKYRKRTLMKNCFINWLVWLRCDHNPKKQKKLESGQLYLRILKKRIFSILSKNKKAYKLKKEKAGKLLGKIRKRLVKLVFENWKIDFPLLLRRKAALKENQIKFTKLRKIRRWKQSLMLLRKKIKKLKSLQDSLIARRANVKKKAFLTDWCRSAFRKRDYRFRLAQQYRDTLKTYFGCWHSYYGNRLLKKFKAKRTDQYLKRKEMTQTSNLFFKWFNYTKKKLRNRNVVLTVKNRNRLVMNRVFFNELQRNQKLALKTTLGGLSSKISLLEANIRENIDFVSSIDDEKAELQQKLSRSFHELTNLKEDNKAKSLEITHLKKALSSLERAEDNQKQSNEDLMIKLEDKQRDMEDVRFELQKIIDEKNEFIEEMKFANQAYARELSLLKNELEFKQNHLSETERTVMERQKAAESIVKETEKKFTNSVKIANEFKIAIEKKELIIKNLENRLINAEDQLRLSSNKSNDSVKILKEATEMYEKRINDYERMIEDLRAENHLFNENNERFLRQIGDLKGDLRKYELEIEILADRHSKKGLENNHYHKSSHSSSSLNDIDHSYRRMDDQYRSFLHFTEVQKEFELKRKVLKDRIEGLQKNLEVFVTSNFKVDQGYNTVPRLETSKESDRSPLRVLSSSRTYTDPQLSTTQSNRFKKEIDFPEGSIRSLRETPKDKGSLRMMNDTTTSKLNKYSLRLNDIGIEKSVQSSNEARSNRNQIRENIEKRIKSLNENLEQDIRKAKTKLEFV